jgi:hypothetical protein
MVKGVNPIQELSGFTKPYFIMALWVTAIVVAVCREINSRLMLLFSGVGNRRVEVV